MVSTGKDFITFSISPKNIAANFMAQWRFISNEEKGLFIKLGKMGEKKMKQLVPVKTGRLRNSVRAQIKQTGSGGVDGRSSIIIGSTGVPYARYQNDGTRPSFGRYIPRLGKRSKTVGMHPGFQGHHFIEETEEFINSVVDTVIGPGIRDAIRRSRGKGGR